jgi:chromosome partitioning protein
VKIRESHEACKPMVHLDPSHRITRALLDLHKAIEDARG